MKNLRRNRFGGEGWLIAAVLGLMLVICALNLMNRMPEKIAAAPVHCVQADLYEFVKIDLNSASKQALMDLPGIGEVLAERIVCGRPYSSPDELLGIDGIGEKVLAKIRPLVKCGETVSN